MLAGYHGLAEGDLRTMDTSSRTRFATVAAGRRTALKAIVAAGAVIFWRPTGSFAQEATPDAPSLFTGETFVGETSDPKTLVAIVLAGAAGPQPRPARGYLCNGLLRTVDVWLMGEADGDHLTLTAEDGSQLSGIFNPAGIGGGATLEDGTSLLYTARPAEEVAGLYTVQMLPTGTMEGSSASGGTLAGALAADDVQAGERFVYDVILTTPEGDSAAITITTATTDEGTFRTILLPSGEGKGQGKTKKGRHWTDPDPQP